MKNFLLIISSFVTIVCNSQESFDFKVTGRLKNFDPLPEKIFLRLPGKTDSVKVISGAYSFKGQCQEPQLAQLIAVFSKDALVAKSEKNVFKFLIEKGKYKILSTDSISNSTLKPYKQAQADLLELSKKYKPIAKSLTDSMENKQIAEKRLEEIYDSITNVFTQLYRQFIIDHPGSPVIIHSLNQYIQTTDIIDVAEAQSLLNIVEKKYKEKPSVIKIAEKIAIAKKIAVGSYAMDFSQDDTLGNKVSLSSFKGKYVLLDFWASWCKPCRAENPNLLKVYNQYRAHNFAILGVSLDREKSKWIEAINHDSIYWDHVSDLKLWSNAVAKQYGVEFIPQNFLIDPEGKIIARNLTGETLQNKLKEIFKAF